VDLHRIAHARSDFDLQAGSRQRPAGDVLSQRVLRPID